MTWVQLLALWCERDSRYRNGRSLTVPEAETVRAYRRTEVAMLARIERPLAIAEMNAWVTPEPLR